MTIIRADHQLTEAEIYDIVHDNLERLLDDMDDGVGDFRHEFSLTITTGSSCGEDIQLVRMEIEDLSFTDQRPLNERAKDMEFREFAGVCKSFLNSVSDAQVIIAEMENEFYVLEKCHRLVTSNNANVTWSEETSYSSGPHTLSDARKEAQNFCFPGDE